MTSRKPRRAGWIRWIGSKSRNAIIKDLIEKTIPLDKKMMTAEAAWNFRYKKLQVIVEEKVQFEQFKERLKDHRKQVLKKIEKEQCKKNSVDKTLPKREKAANKTKKKKEKAAKRLGWIKWRTCKFKAIILNDLVDGRLPIDNKLMTAESAWELHYKNLSVVLEEKVLFDQFKERLQDHRKQMGKNATRAASDKIAARRSRKLFCRKERNKRNELVFCIHPANKLLRADIEAGHDLGKSPIEFQSSRKEYQEFSARKFKHRIYQEIKYQKFMKHLEERRKAGKF